MAELSLSRTSRSVPKVDLTAMVDLAFFMLTTSLSKPVAMDVAKPDEPINDKQLPWPASRTMTILLGANDKIAWYMGEPGKSTPTIEDFSQIRKSIIANQEMVAKANHNDRKKPLYIIIKPTSGANYKNFVDIMDELKLVDLKTAPAIDDDHILKEELDFMKQKGIR
ncbi:ExbD/TolR family protein [Pedobacter ginsengisoli]|uniref:ExbD/TolR family protein n=1 Tax=Pedobacter ginsengisoli TaxID=363852 RepID=UPI002550B137|nr:biopolymer transporter ExbD [Pedobacter ginsengisoli]